MSTTSKILLEDLQGDRKVALVRFYESKQMNQT